MNNISLNSYGGIGRVSILPLKGEFHGQIVEVLGDNLVNPELFTWHELLNKWIPMGANGKGGVHGGIFFVNATPTSTGNIGSKIYDEDNVVLRSFVSDTENITLKILAITGHTHYTPIINYGEIIIPVTPLVDRPLFEGFFNININGLSSIKISHEDGAEAEINFKYENLPKILSATFIGGYPTTNGIVQTTLKENDVMQLNIKTDVDIIKVEVADFGCYKSKTYNVSGTDVTIIGDIANRGNTPQFLGAKVRVMKSTGSWSDWFLTNSQGSTEKVHVLKLNNLKPTINVTNIIYPSGQEALKNSETSIISHTITNFDSVIYECPNGELNISNVNTYETSKTVTRINGNYNISTQNVKITAYRNENGSNTIVNKIVQIAHVDPIITVEEQYARLRSSSTGSNYFIKLISNQKLLSTPTLNIPVGTWVGNFTTSDNITWTKTISVSDSDSKGTFNYSSMSAINLAGKVVTAITGNGDYTVGGIVSRKLTFPAFQSTVPIESSVENISKTSVIDLSGYVFTYQASFDNNPLTFTIVNASGLLYNKGGYLKITDQNIVNQNSTSTYYVFFEETV